MSASTQARSLVGVLPAAGRATRLPELPCSKEVVLLDPLAAPGYRTPCERLLVAMRHAGARRAYVVLGHGKWDVPAYLDDGAAANIALAYLTIRDSPSTPATVARARAFVAEDVVAFGFPDILFEPEDALERLRRQLETTGADVVLGLFPAEDPALVDMVETDAGGRVLRIEIKPLETRLGLAWILAVWTPVFTGFLCDWVASDVRLEREPYVGDVLQAAVDSGLRVESVTLPGEFRDLGTPEQLRRAMAEGYPAGPRPTPT